MSGPFADSTVAAVGACTRALGGIAGDVRLDDEAATIGGLRAAGDRIALRHRHHDPAVHARHRPEGERAGVLFDAIESARLDAIGVAWLRGVGQNLLAHPGRSRDGVRWFAFEALSGEPAPAVKADLVARVRTTLPPGMRDELVRLRAAIADHPRFAAAAADWAGRAATRLRADPAAPAADAPLSRRTVIRQLPRRGDPGATAAALRSRQKHDAPPGDGESGTAGAVDGRGLPISPYHAYTTAHDRVIDAGRLATRDELAELRRALDAELGAVRALAAKLAKRLMRVLMARQIREWRFDLDEGVLDGSRLAPFVASRGATRPFKAEAESRFPQTVVTLLIDHSGSMRGRPMKIAALTVEVFARVLERCGVRCEVLGFTTRDWDGGAPAREWAAHGYPENPGRLNALEHVVIKSADVPWRRARVGLGLFLHDEMLKENIDGEAVAWAHARLAARTERRRVLVVVSDGTPMDEATMAANGHEYLERHLQEVIDGIQRRSPVQLAAIGIGHDVSLFYANATKIARIEELGPALTSKLMTLLADDAPPG